MQNEEMLFEIFDEKGNLKNKEDVIIDSKLKNIIYSLHL